MKLTISLLIFENISSFDKKEEDKNTRRKMSLPCNNLCCKCLWTCQNLLFWPEDHSPPSSSWLPDHDAQSVEMPSRSSQLQFGWLYEASGTDRVHHSSAKAVHPLGSWHLAHGLWWENHQRVALLEMQDIQDNFNARRFDLKNLIFCTENGMRPTKKRTQHLPQTNMVEVLRCFGGVLLLLAVDALTVCKASLNLKTTKKFWKSM